jgi:large subunit ribosomal protein L7/L12
MESAMNIANDQILEAVGNMTVMQLCELTKAIEDRFGVKASDVVQVSAPTVQIAPAVEEQTEFKVVLSEIGEKRIQVIKIFRELTGAALMEANKLTVVGAIVKEGLGKAEAEVIKTKFEAVGAKVEVR